MLFHRPRKAGKQAVQPFGDIHPTTMKFGDSFFLCFHLPHQDHDRDAEAVPNPKFRGFTYNELKAATQVFSNKIGEGGFGAVYKGRLIGDNYVAVKVLSVELESLRGEREFISEIAALSLIRHENLVNLQGCCVHGTQRLLVYDYMENNCLSQAFLGSEQKRAKFTWGLRKHVALGVARGLRYLHEEITPHIVHRDIKASNILLDENLMPKLADFGLAKLFRDSRSYVSTRVAGTLGYLSPEYAYSGHLSRKSDVYSFGVLLLEIVSGQPIIDYHVQHGEQFLVEKAWELYNSGNLIELVDPSLKGEYPLQEAIRFLKVGLLCVQLMTKLRPKMSAAIKMMKGDDEGTDFKVTQPGIIADLMIVKTQRQRLPNLSSSVASSTPRNSFQGR